MESLTFNLEAIHLAEELNIRDIKEHFKEQLLHGQATELFYQLSGENRFLYIFPYGSVAFANVEEEEKNAIIKEVLKFATKPLQEVLKETHRLIIRPKSEIHFKFSELIVPMNNPNLIRICLFTLAQSAALEYYNGVSETLLSEIKNVAKELEQKGRIHISKREMMKFIGRSLNTKNSVIENLYIFEAPAAVWNDEYLNKVNMGLSQFFELTTRFKEIEYKFKFIDDNLDTYLTIYNQKENSRLEWIIIILILIEVVNLFLSKLAG